MEPCFVWKGIKAKVNFSNTSCQSWITRSRVITTLTDKGPQQCPPTPHYGNSLLASKIQFFMNLQNVLNTLTLEPKVSTLISPESAIGHNPKLVPSTFHHHNFNFVQTQSFKWPLYRRFPMKILHVSYLPYLSNISSTFKTQWIHVIVQNTNFLIRQYSLTVHLHHPS